MLLALWLVGTFTAFHGAVSCSWIVVEVEEFLEEVHSLSGITGKWL